MTRANGSSPALALVLHAHLPYVRHEEFDSFLEERWLFEALLECYLPLLRTFDRLEEEALPFRCTVSLSPTLLDMWADPLLQERFGRHLDALIALAEEDTHRLREDGRFHPVAKHYRDEWARLRRYWQDDCKKNPLTRFMVHRDAGHLELITTAATHAYLPLFQRSPEAVHAQIATGLDVFQNASGSAAPGFWLPECAYTPGFERELARAGLRYFFLDAHGLLHAEAPPQHGVFAPVACENGVAAFARDPECTRRVWSAHEGYPGHPDYREFYRDRGHELEPEQLGAAAGPEGVRVDTGLKYHRITGATELKQPYLRKAALRRAEEHAEDFVSHALARGRLAQSAMDRPALLTAPFDAELFGHWWHEGPEWIEAVVRCAARGGLELVTPSDWLERHPRLQIAPPAESSWGEGGAHEPWLTPANAWMRDEALDAALRLTARFRDMKGSGITPVQRRSLDQAARHVLLAMASDWPFMVARRTSAGFAERTARDQLDRFAVIERMWKDHRIQPRTLAALEQLDPVFARINPFLFAPQDPEKSRKG